MTIENEIDERIREISFREKKPYRVVVNEVLRRGLGVMSPTVAKDVFRVKPFSFSFPDQWDEENLRHLSYELEDQQLLAKLNEPADPAE